MLPLSITIDSLLSLPSSPLHCLPSLLILSPHLTSPRLTSPHLTSSTSPHLFAPHLTSSHLSRSPSPSPPILSSPLLHSTPSRPLSLSLPPSLPRTLPSPSLPPFAPCPLLSSPNHVNAVSTAHACRVLMKFPPGGFDLRPHFWVRFWGPLLAPQKMSPPTVGGHFLGGLFWVRKWPQKWGRALCGPKMGAVSGCHPFDTRLCLSLTDMLVSVCIHRSPIPDGGGGQFWS